MGLKIRETSGIQRNLPTTRTNLANNLHQQAANTLSNSSNSVVNTTGTQGYQDFKRGFKVILVKVQVNLCQKYLFSNQLTHNMTKDCSLIYQFST